MSFVVRSIAMATCVAIALGCDESAVRPALVHGWVRYLGAPVPGARLAFVPDESRGNRGDILRAVTEADGTFVLRSPDPAGVPPGWYLITVMALEERSTANGFAVPHSLLPENYRDPKLSELSCEIQPGQDNSVQLDLH